MFSVLDKKLWVKSNKPVLNVAWNDHKYMSKDQLKTLLRALIIILSSMGFVYQTSQLFALYFSGKTSVDNRVERLKHSALPAVTICLPTFISMDRFAEQILKNSTNQTLENLYQEYLEFKGKSNLVWNEQAISQQEKLHMKFVFEVFPFVNISLIDFFDKISVQEMNITFFNTKAFTKDDQLIELSRPLVHQSVVPFSDPRKCFTIFSGFDPYYRHNIFNLVQMEIKFYHDNNTFPLNQYYQGDFHISLHSPNILPLYIREESFKSLNMGRVNAISYSEIKTRLLPAPYDTDCQTYPLDDLGQNNIRSDCIQKCVDENMSKTDPKIDCIHVLYNLKLIRRENLFNMSLLTFCNLYFDKELKIILFKKQTIAENDCMKSCAENCDESYYDFTIEKIKGHSWVKLNNEFAITLKHNRFPDQIITHKPVMRWIELISNFGGLLGMWLGLSIAFVLDVMIVRFI